MNGFRAACAGLLVLLTIFDPAVAADDGRAIYRISAPGRQACAGCHGRDGLGGSEGVVRAPAISWDVLSVEQGYDAARLSAALAQGVAADGRRLSGMPRYSLSSSELAALAGYLVRLPQEDTGGISGDRVAIAAMARGKYDPWPRLLADSTARHTKGRPVFSRRIEIVTVTTSSALSAQDFFIATGLSAPYPTQESEALAQHGIPNVFPRGFLSGNEVHADALGWLPTLSQIVSAAERRSECGAEPPVILAPDPATALRLNRAIGTMGEKPTLCRLALGVRGDTTLPFAALQFSGGTLHFDPGVTAGPAPAALHAFADMVGERIVSALTAAGPAVTRTRFMNELMRTARSSAGPPVFR